MHDSLWDLMEQCHRTREQTKTMRICIDIPDKISPRDTRIASMEKDGKGLKARLEKSWRKYLRRYKPLVIPIRCEFCVLWLAEIRNSCKINKLMGSRLQSNIAA